MITKVHGQRCYNRPMKSSLVSAMIHAVIVGLVVLITPGIGSTRQRPPERPPIMIYRPPAPEDPGPIHHGRGGAAGDGSIHVPTTVPPTIPPIDVPRPGPFRIVQSDSTWDAAAGPTHPGGNGSGQSPTGVLAADVVDVQVKPYAGAPTPRYPEGLRAADVEGEVTLEFVVDTTGRVEGGSLRVISSTAQPFVVSVCDALKATRYHPALVGGRPVRQLVRQQFVFSLTQH
jgi:TonB family protein